MQHNDFIICVNNEGYEASLELRKIYEALQDPEAEQHGQVRVIDESGEDYLYPNSMFMKVDLPDSIVERLIRAA